MTWTVTMRTGENEGSIVRDIRTADYVDAIAITRRIVGGIFCSVE